MRARVVGGEGQDLSKGRFRVAETTARVVEATQGVVRQPVISPGGNRLLVRRLRLVRTIQCLIRPAELTVGVAVQRIQLYRSSSDGNGFFVAPAPARNQRQRDMHRGEPVVDLQRLSATVDRAVDPRRILVRLILSPIRLAEPGMRQRITIVDADGTREAFDRQVDVLWTIEPLQISAPLHVLLVCADGGRAASRDGATRLGVELQVEQRHQRADDDLLRGDVRRR